MNIPGLLIGIAAWLAVYAFGPTMPTWLRVIVAIVIGVLTLMLIGKIARRLVGKDKT